jgi:3-oxoacyl-[acyl-carrier protein] reductase
MNDFAGKNVAVLNATGAIARDVVQNFAARGLRVAAIDTPAAFAAAADWSQGKEVSQIMVTADAAALLDSCERALGGPVDILVCAAPPVGQVTILDMQAADLRRIVEDELCVPALLMQEAGRRMARRGNGRIISLFSMSAKTGVHTKVGPFAAAKGGLLAYSRVMAAELAPTGVTVNAIATSLFEPQVAILEYAEREALAKAIPVRRFGKVSEASHAVLFLASDQAAFITGETMNLSGGRFMD